MVCSWDALYAFWRLPWMQAVFYGVGAAVIGIITLSTYRLSKKAWARTGCYGHLPCPYDLLFWRKGNMADAAVGLVVMAGEITARF